MTTHVALAALIAKIDEIHEHPTYKGVWTIAHVHGMLYSGPTYVQELEDARAALSELSESPIANCCVLCHGRNQRPGETLIEGWWQDPGPDGEALTSRGYICDDCSVVHWAARVEG